jgi:RimJ/RimL family protein N-acetyltransferase
VILRPATRADFGFIRSLAQRPDYAPFITDEDDSRLTFYASDPAHRLLIAETGGHAQGFALYAEIGDPSGRVELRRLGLAETGKGRGLAFVRLLTAYGFETLGARKVWLDASGENLRAQKVYDRAGYRLEGRLLDHWFRPALGRNVDVMLYGLSRDEWQALAAPAAQA